MAQEDAEIEDELHYYAAEMLNATAEANQCKQGDGQSMEQQQQETMKLPLYSQTKGRKKITAAKKSDKRAQIRHHLQEESSCSIRTERHLDTGNVVCATRLRDTTS